MKNMMWKHEAKIKLEKLNRDLANAKSELAHKKVLIRHQEDFIYLALSAEACNIPDQDKILQCVNIAMNGDINYGNRIALPLSKTDRLNILKSFGKKLDKKREEEHELGNA